MAQWLTRVCRVVYNRGMSNAETLNQTFPYTLAKGTVNGEELPTDYVIEAKLAQEAADLSGSLDKQQWRTIFAAIRSGLPVIITRTVENGRTEKVTAIITYASVHTPSSSRIRVSYWGFGHYIHVSKIQSVETPSVEFVK